MKEDKYKIFGGTLIDFIIDSKDDTRINAVRFHNMSLLFTARYTNEELGIIDKEELVFKHLELADGFIEKDRVSPKVKKLKNIFDRYTSVVKQMNRLYNLIKTQEPYMDTSSFWDKTMYFEFVYLFLLKAMTAEELLYQYENELCEYNIDTRDLKWVTEFMYSDNRRKNKHPFSVIMKSMMREMKKLTVGVEEVMQNIMNRGERGRKVKTVRGLVNYQKHEDSIERIMLSQTKDLNKLMEKVIIAKSTIPQLKYCRSFLTHSLISHHTKIQKIIEDFDIAEENMKETERKYKKEREEIESKYNTVVAETLKIVEGVCEIHNRFNTSIDYRKNKYR